MKTENKKMRSNVAVLASTARAKGRRSAVALAGACILPIVVVSLAAVTKAGATTIDTYDFTQGGYALVGQPGSGVLTGSFTGTVEANGFIELTDISSISVTFSTPPAAAFGHGPTSFFSFDTAGGSSSLNLATAIGLVGNACVGTPAAFGIGGCGSGGVNGFTLFWTTQDLPVVTLVSSLTVPEPSAWAMMLIGFAGLGFAGFRQVGKGRTVVGRP
jgi:hypothetical protein